MPSTQGVTFERMTLTVVRPSGTTVYTHYRTYTQTQLARQGSTMRTNYNTALG